MSDPAYSKCACQHCGQHLEFPVAAAGSVIECPECRLQIELVPDPKLSSQAVKGTEGLAALTAADIEAAIGGEISRTRTSPLYQLGLVIVAITMVVLPIVYLAMIGAAAWGVYSWATHGLFLFRGGGGARVLVLKGLCYAAPLFAGVVVVFFMIKPLLARRARHAQPLALNPGAEPLLFTFIARICRAVGAPMPQRIDLDCQLNASAGFRRGALSFLGNDLVLTIGLPLVAGLSIRELAGVLAHEFGHFTQGLGMRLTYVIRSINAWFARVAYERDAWDVTLQEWAETDDWRVALIVGVARLGVWFSRLLLKLLMWTGHAIGCFMLRQMEYDADSCEIKLAGSDAFETTVKRFHTLGAALKQTYKDVRVSWNSNRHLPENFPAYLMRHDHALPAAQRTQIEDKLGLRRTGLFDTHPSDGDRIRCACKAALPGVVNLDAPATSLFSNFDAVSKQITLLHYSDDLGIPIVAAKMMPV